MGAYQQTDFVRIEQIENPDNPPHAVSMSHVTSLCALFHMYGFYYSQGTLSVTFYHVLNAHDVTTSSTGGVTAGCHVLNNRAKRFFLDGRHLPQVMRQLHMGRDEGWIQQHILLRLIVHKDRVEISEAKAN